MIRRTLIALVTLVALAACGGTHEAAPGGSPGSGSAAPTGSCVATLPPSGPASPAAGGAVPDLTLACFPGGGDVRLGRLGRPAVINLWASWCAPCRTELPAFETYARRAGRAVAVVGVATETSRPAAQSIIDDLGLTFPMLYDREKKLLQGVGKVNLPLTLFVDARGTLAHAYQESVLDAATIERLAGQYLGVVFTG